MKCSTKSGGIGAREREAHLDKLLLVEVDAED